MQDNNELSTLLLNGQCSESGLCKKQQIIILLKGFKDIWL